MFKKLMQQLKIKEKESQNPLVTSPVSVEKERAKKMFLNLLSQQALKLYDKKTDIKNFTKLVISDPDNKDYEELIDKIFSSGVKDYMTKEQLDSLSKNEDLINDINLM